MDRQYSQYYKDVSKLDVIDVYRVLKLWNVTDPTVQHAIKKLLASGERGYKDEGQDIKEAIDSLVRGLEMRSEEMRFEV